jgi:hypothetical protein
MPSPRSRVHSTSVLVNSSLQFATQPFETGDLRTAHHRAEIGAQHMFDALNAWLLQQRQTKQFGEDLLASKRTMPMPANW